jgi:c-di-GMP-binding flagellar brake protein YcgR
VENIEKIYGDRRIRLFRLLKKTRTVMNLIVPGKEFQRLTIVTGLALKGETPCLLIDPPRGIGRLTSASLNGRIIFQFIGVDRLPYVFRSTLYKMAKNALWIRLPAYVERIQRRKGFRITPPSETTLRFVKDGRPCQGEVKNISEGGALITPLAGRKWTDLLNENDTIRRLIIQCSENKHALNLELNQAMVTRVSKESMTGRYYYALQFLIAEKDKKEVLVDWLYQCQRDILQERFSVNHQLQFVS